MKKLFLKIVLSVFAFAALAFSAKAQIADQLIVNVPYEFVAAGKVLPAGTYRLIRGNDSSGNELLLSSFENRTGVIVVPSEWDDGRNAPASLTFQQINGQYFLSKINTAEHVFILHVPQSAILDAAKKSNRDWMRSTTTTQRSN